MDRRNLLKTAGATTLAAAAGTGMAAADASASTDCSPECCRDCPGICFHCDCRDCGGGGDPIQVE